MLEQSSHGINGIMYDKMLKKYCQACFDGKLKI